jgi:lycopene cyclase domain-containing protein
MNIVSLVVVFIIGLLMWVRSGVRPTQRFFLIGLAVSLIIWWGIWGQIAIADGWWVYDPKNISGGFIGVIPATDALYFLAGLGWYFYLCHKLELL